MAFPGTVGNYPSTLPNITLANDPSQKNSYILNSLASPVIDARHRETSNQASEIDDPSASRLLLLTIKGQKHSISGGRHRCEAGAEIFHPVQFNFRKRSSAIECATYIRIRWTGLFRFSLSCGRIVDASSLIGHLIPG